MTQHDSVAQRGSVEPGAEQVVVLGAGPAGLGIARELKHRHGVDPLIVDRSDAPAASWRARYDGFRLNTCGFWSHLPGQRIPLSFGRWPTRDQMVEYFDDYVRRQGLRLRLGVRAERIDRDGAGWSITTDDADVRASAVVVALGNHNTPGLPPWPGMDGFTGQLLHAADYRSAEPFGGQEVLVVGSGNSAVDIALQLSSAVAAKVWMSVRTPPQLVPRSTAGLPIDTLGPLLATLPVWLLDGAATAMRRVWFGELAGVGLPPPRQGIHTALRAQAKVPTIADELVPRVKDGRIEIVSAVESFETNRVVLADGTALAPQVVIGATGYRRGLDALVGHLGVLTDDGHPVTNGPPAAAPGLWFAGYEEPLIGPLRAFRRQAPDVAAEVVSHLAASSAASQTLSR